MAHGRGTEALGLSSYDPLSSEGANVNLLIPNADIDPISASVPHGGRSTGPKTQAGRARIAEAQRLRWRGYRERLRASGLR